MVLGAELGSCSRQPWKGSEFTAMLGLAGDLCGLLSLRCRQESATLVASSMLDLAPENAAEHACDAIGEVANMIAGNFKNKLSGTARKCLLSVPTVITGADYSFRSLVDTNPLDLWFTYRGMPLEISLEIHS